MDTQKILKAHDRQLRFAPILAKVGYDSRLGKILRLWLYYTDAILILQAWTPVLKVRKAQIGDKFYAVDQAIVHASHENVQNLMQTEPQLRGNDLGIIRILAPSYLLNNPLSLGMNGQEHAGARALFLQALPDPVEAADELGRLVEQTLTEASQRGELQVGTDLPKMMVWLLHQVVFGIALSPEEVTASNNYLNTLTLATLPNFAMKVLLAFKTRPCIQHRQRLIEKYKQSPKWQMYLETGAQYQLNEHQIANSLFDMIHIAGTAGTSALLGSVLGMLCLDEALRTEAVAEMDTVWDGQGTPTGSALNQLERFNAAIFETARLYPPVRFVSQLAQTEGEVEIGAKKCPMLKGTRLLGSIFSANRDPNRYEQPDRFNPQRDFSDLLSWNGKEHERACPGRSLSIGLVKMFCLYLFKRYQWNSFTEVKWDLEKVTPVTPNTLTLQSFAQKKS
jgi:cytochrome P450